jgi:hypothetical protein
MWRCKHCQIEFDFDTTTIKANHSRWCDQNPKRNVKRPRKPSVFSNKETWKRSIADAHKRGCYKNVKRKFGILHTKETKEKLRTIALNSKHRRILRSTRNYTMVDGTVVLLDSSWEEALAKRLDFLKIKWIRPKTPIQWKDDTGKSHNYFPDFYLSDYDIWLDPKNDQVYKLSKEKIEAIMKILPNLKIIRTLKECNEFNI